MRLLAGYIVQSLHVGLFTAALCNGGSRPPVKLPLFGQHGGFAVLLLMLREGYNTILNLYLGKNLDRVF